MMGEKHHNSSVNIVNCILDFLVIKYQLLDWLSSCGNTVTNLALLCHLVAENDCQFCSFWNKYVLFVLTGSGVLVVSQVSGLRRARRCELQALRGGRDWALGLYDGDLALLCLSLPALPPRLLLKVWGCFLWGEQLLGLLECFLFLLITGLWNQKSAGVRTIYNLT